MAKTNFTRPRAKNSRSAINVYQMVTDRLVERLESGVNPWRKPWQSYADYGIDRPYNLQTMKGYRGINVFMLGNAPFDIPYWVTFKQCEKLGGRVKAGQKAGSLVVFWKLFDRPARADERGDKDGLVHIPFLRYSRVFNVAQCDGLESRIPEKVKPEERTHTPIESAESVVRGYKDAPGLTHVESRAYYRPSLDVVNMPKPETFENPESYYDTLFHEFAHSTGHKSRLARKNLMDLNTYGNSGYSHEELVAEMAGAMLSATCGIDTAEMTDNSAAYLNGWIKALRGTPKLAVQAGAQAQKAADWIIGTRNVEGN